MEYSIYGRRPLILESKKQHLQMDGCVRWHEGHDLLLMFLVERLRHDGEMCKKKGVTQGTFLGILTLSLRN